MIRLSHALAADLHHRIAQARTRPDKVWQSFRSRCNRYDIDVAPLSGWWRVTDRLSGASTEGEAPVEIPAHTR